MEEISKNKSAHCVRKNGLKNECADSGYVGIFIKC